MVTFQDGGSLHHLGPQVTRGASLSLPSLVTYLRLGLGEKYIFVVLGH